MFLRTFFPSPLNFSLLPYSVTPSLCLCFSCRIHPPNYNSQVLFFPSHSKFLNQHCFACSIVLKRGNHLPLPPLIQRHANRVQYTTKHATRHRVTEQFTAYLKELPIQKTKHKHKAQMELKQSNSNKYNTYLAIALLILSGKCNIPCPYHS